MKLILITLLISLLGCSYIEKHKKSDDKKSLFNDIYSRALVYEKLIGNPYNNISRCDGLTFVGPYWAFMSNRSTFDIYKHEYSINEEEKRIDGSGQWNRDVKPCYPNDSRSGISTEGLLGALHAIRVAKDKDAIDRLIKFAEENKWIMGDGPEEYTRLIHLAPIAYKLQEVLNGSFSSGETSDAVSNPWAKISGYRGNVIADYIGLKGAIYGYLRGYELEFLKTMIEKVPNNPFYLYLYHSYTDSDYTKLIEVLTNETYFPLNKLPGKNAREVFSWGDAPHGLLYVWISGMIKEDGN